MNSEISKLAGITVLYNPEYDIYANIQTYVGHLDILILVDNSTSHNTKLVDDLISNFNNIIYINNKNNLGIATALNIGCNKAIDLGYKWTLTMDQDSSFINFESYKKCFLKFNDSKKIAIMGATHICLTKFKDNMSTFFSDKFLDDNTEKSLAYLSNASYSCEYEEIEFIITSGNIISLDIYLEIGCFNDSLFIDEVDFDFCAKCLLKDYKIIKFNNIHFKHELGYYKDGVPQHNYIRKYYIFRNRLYMASKYGKNFPEEYSYSVIISQMRKSLSHIWRKEEDRNMKIKSFFMAIYDFSRNKFGKKF